MQTAKARICQFVPGGKDSTSAVADQPVLPTGFDAVTMIPGSDGTTAKPPPVARPAEQVTVTTL